MRGDSHKVTEVRQSLKLLPAPILTVAFFPRDSAISYQADLGFFQGQKLGMTSHCPPPKHITFSSVLPVMGLNISLLVGLPRSLVLCGELGSRSASFESMCRGEETIPVGLRSERTRPLHTLLRTRHQNGATETGNVVDWETSKAGQRNEFRSQRPKS